MVEFYDDGFDVWEVGVWDEVGEGVGGEVAAVGCLSLDLALCLLGGSHGRENSCIAYLGGVASVLLLGADVLDGKVAFGRVLVSSVSEGRE